MNSRHHYGTSPLVIVETWTFRGWTSQQTASWRHFKLFPSHGQLYSLRKMHDYLLPSYIKRLSYLAEKKRKGKTH
jgi:hypothetical protein